MKWLPLIFALLVTFLSPTVSYARFQFELDVDLRAEGPPRHTRFRQVRRFGWHSGLHYGPYTDARGRRRVGWHDHTHLDWYSISVPVVDKIDEADWQMFVQFGRRGTLRLRGDAVRDFRRRRTIGTSGDSILGWITDDGRVIVTNPPGHRPDRFFGHGWTGLDLGNSLIMADVEPERGVQVYLRRRTKHLPSPEGEKTAETPEERLLQAREKLKRDALLDEADRKFALAAYQQAVRLYNQALDLDKEDPIARFAIAHCLFALGVYRTAGRNIRIGLDAYPEWGVVNLELPKFYRRDDEFDHHLDKLRKHAERHPADRDVQLLLGYCLHFSGRRDEARRQFEKLAKPPRFDRHADLFLQFYQRPSEEQEDEPPEE